MVAQCYLRVRIDVQVEHPLPPGFFQAQDDGLERWIQFKFERLSDFCFKCGMFDHVIGCCSIAEPSTVKSSFGVVSRLYGLWLRAGVTGGVVFVNLKTSDDLSTKVATDVAALNLIMTGPSKCSFLSMPPEGMETVNNSEKSYEEEMVEKHRRGNLLHLDLKGLEEEIKVWLGLGPGCIRPAFGLARPSCNGVGSKKREALLFLEGSSREGIMDRRSVGYVMDQGTNEDTNEVELAEVNNDMELLGLLAEVDLTNSKRRESEGATNI
ncbi:hypothetical protein FNV43_RR13493 [Rhamnella rubrinervis]|uniref:Zinc knuckle CX2CX4HX4C domain-containing protein n=1 Tax=Rhamnella rubrinervis TaxID=2594499 RepID=A0A8K0H1D8_9ROSA|nr:hypothetical protein FNV43_RR13493 [Rhamnella rubrinervis]